MRVFKLRNKEGLFSSGGSCPVFTEKGKMWHGVGHIKLHLNALLKNKWTIPDDWEIIAYDLFESEVQNAKKSYEDYWFERKAKEEARARVSHISYIKSEIARLESLKKQLKEEK